MIRTLVLFLVLQALFGFCYCQTELDISGLPTIPVAIKNSRVSDPLNQINLVIIKDVRPDNYCIGFMKVKKKHRPATGIFGDYSGIVTENGILADLEKCLNNFEKSENTNGFDLLLCLRECWLYDNDLEIKQQNFNVQNGPATCGLLFKADIYLEKEQQYIPLLRIDTVLHSTRNLAKESKNLLSDVINIVREKINSIPLKTIYEPTTKYKTKANLDSFYASSNKIVPFVDSDTSHQYIVENFDDFRRGRFIKTSLRYTTDKLGDYFYRKDAGGNEYPITCFGIIKGGQLYVRTNNTYSIMFLHKNRLYTLGSKMIREKTSRIPIIIPFGFAGISGGMNYNMYAFGGEAVGSSDERALQPMTMDMSNGKIY